jgi:acyl-CoA synthetase (AMP-forming)/AMP-acid ligase II
MHSGRFDRERITFAAAMGMLKSIAASARQSVSDSVFEAKVLHEAGIVGLVRPDKAAKVATTFLRWGASPATGVATAAHKYPHETMLIDERGSLSFERVHKRTNALAHAFAGMGIGPGDGVGIMCRNHRGFIEATLAAAKLGASALYLNTMFAGPQLVEVTRREAPKALVYDEEFSGLLDGVDEGIARIVAWSDSEVEGPTLDSLIAANGDSDHKPPPDNPRFVILTSGTTGTPKGAQRSSPDGLLAMAALIDRIPYRARDTMMVAAPLFHSWGFFHFVMSLPTASTMVLRRRFNEEETLRAVQDHRADVLGVVPVMLQRILRLPEKTLASYDLSSLRITSASGSALPGELAIEWMDRFGDTVYNLYGSTEVAYATVATPEDLRAAPGTAGRPPRGTVVRLLDESGREVPDGEVGRIFVGNEMSFEGYTGGGNKEAIDGLLSSGDVGHFDAGGRLFIDGRDDEMIVSGGENVFPREVEDLLADHAGVVEVAVIGVEDAEFGQRLKAFVVTAREEEVSAEDLKAHVKANLAAYKAPREFEFLDELPRNATGKILKRELHEREAQSRSR